MDISQGVELEDILPEGEAFKRFVPDETRFAD
jgi:hypothetical protein